jgi:hypothetical protein
MDRLQFVVPVRIVPDPAEPITEIYSVDEALTFLQNLPERAQGQVFQTAMNYCFGAKIEQNSTGDARRAFAGFCRVAGIAAKDMPDALTIGPDGEIRPMPGSRPG